MSNVEEIRSRVKYYNKSDQITLNVLLAEIDRLNTENERLNGLVKLLSKVNKPNVKSIFTLSHKTKR